MGVSSGMKILKLRVELAELICVNVSGFCLFHAGDHSLVAIGIHWLWWCCFGCEAIYCVSIL